MELDDIKSIFDAARKYDMEHAEEIIRSALISARFLDQAPMRVFGIVCALRLATEAQIVAAATLDSNVADLDYVPELEYLSGGDIHHLQMYHKACRKVAQDIAGEIRDLVDPECFRWWFKCGEVSAICPFGKISGSKIKAATWWIDNYLAPCQEKLKNAPMGKKVTASECIGAALLAAQACPECKHTSLVDLEDFAWRFSREIDKAIAKVLIDVDP
ncbi:hypothetical protein FIBSPDRAFT_857221, partial [Athelia psychrophila]